MIYNIYHIECLLAGACFLICGLMLLFIDIPDNPLLGNYRKARYMMIAAYLFLVVMNVAVYYFGISLSSNPLLLQAVVLTIAFFQAALFTLSLLALLETDTTKKRHLFVEALLLIGAVFVVYAVCSEAVLKVAFYIFTGIYALLLVRYTRLFIAGYKRFRLQMDNYFSDLEAGRMRWVAFSFFAALTIGIMALLSAVFVSAFILLIFTAVYGVFYIWFAIRFINYAQRFHEIENAISNETEEQKNEETITVKSDITDAKNFAALEKRIDEWVQNKHFTEKGITINMLVQELLTNRSYLSSYINTCKGKTFREWINELRIEEAKNLLKQYPKMTITEISEKVGFSDIAIFRWHFINFTNVSPKEYKKSQVKETQDKSA